MKKSLGMCLLAVALTQSIATPLSFSPAIFHEADTLLQTHHESYYDHKTVIDESIGYYRVDCSSFVCHILRKKAPLALATLPKDTHHAHARAQNFYEYFKQLESFLSPHWMAITRFSDLRRGDIIAWKYDASLEKRDTGHVVIVAEHPMEEAPHLYRLRVIDASKGKHAQDTRVNGRDGIGSGVMWFRVDEEDRPISLHWSSRAKKPLYHSIAMGRVLQ